MTRSLANMTDEQLARRGVELAYHLLECAIDPDHPASRANRARWERELRQVTAVQARRARVDSTPGSITL